MGHKYVGLDVHQSSTVAMVHDEKGRAGWNPSWPLKPKRSEIL
jgi:hypothetical protein